MAPTDLPPPPGALDGLALHLLAAKYFMIASFVMLVYDIVITMDMEVERIWQQKFTGATALYFLNRYLPALEYIVIIAAFHEPSLSEPNLCNRVVRFAGASTQLTVGVIGLILMLRTYALYGRNMYILVGLAALWLGEMAVMAYSLTHSVRVPLPPGFVGCILTAEPHFELLTSFFWICPMIFDATIFLLTLARTVFLARRQVRLPLLLLILRDGSTYFFAIVAVNVVNVLLFLLAPPDLQAINATFSQLIASLLVSRLILNLKSQSSQRPAASAARPLVGASEPQTEPSSFFSTVVGILGAQIDHNRPLISGYEMQTPFASPHSFVPQIPSSPSHRGSALGTPHQRVELGLGSPALSLPALHSPLKISSRF